MNQQSELQVMEQINTKMIRDSLEGCLAVCVDKDSRYYGWLFYKGGNGQWITKRLALPMEIERAKAKLLAMQIQMDIPGKE